MAASRNSPVERLSVGVWIAAGAKLALHLATNHRYGYFGDELYYLACADHLGWGYVDHPPFSIALLAGWTSIFGDSLASVRFPSALVGAASVLLAGMLARRLERLQTLESEIDNTRAYQVDVTDRKRLAEVFEAVGRDLGPPKVIVHNAVRGTFGNVLDLEPADLEQNFRVNVLALLHLTQIAAPAMIDGDGGAIIITGNTAARRGRANYAGFAPTKAAQRILAESMARHLGPQGIHVAYVIIDAVIDSARARERMIDRDDTFFIKPSAIAETVWQLAHQDPSGWSFEVDLRPFTEQW